MMGVPILYIRLQQRKKEGPNRQRSCPSIKQPSNPIEFPKIQKIKMIQELLGASTFVPGERNFSINNNTPIPLPQPTPSSSPSPSSTTSVTSSTTTATATAAISTNSENQNLRCPRCDSSNTKFCYYNNYNLTQPRHFCKTCRRYWTKGGALRNVPIGGGCRKNKNPSVSNSVAKQQTATKMKAMASELSGGSSSSSGLGPSFNQELPQTPILWGSPQNAHILALLRATQNQNQNPNPNPNPMSITVKEEGMINIMRSQSHMVNEPLLANGMMNNPRSTSLGYDGVGQAPSLGLCSSFWRNNIQDHTQQQSNNGFVLGEHQSSSGVQELYNKLRSSSSMNNYCCSDNSPVFLGNMASSSSLSNILESSSVSGSEFGCWNPTLSWSGLPTTNGAYPN